ncbi:MAG TPA: hypothetical protein VLM75_14515 [Spirochaetota bacterium]|nr:hypothetical protein [Spirochaetota bacterium]
MSDTPFYLDPRIRNHIITETGDLDENGLRDSENAALDVGERLIGSTLITNNTLYIIAMVELYYGGIGDECHDWWRKQFKARKNSKSWKNTPRQMEAGLRFYSKMDRKSNWNRIDIVVGPEGVPVSFLLRNLIKEDGKLLVPRATGGPGITAKELLHDALLKHPEIDFNPPDIIPGKHSLHDTHDAFFNVNDIQSCRKWRCRNNNFVGLKGKYEKSEWNISIYKDQFELPDRVRELKSTLKAISE